MPQATLCLSCNAPAPEYDEYQELAHEILTCIADGVTLLRQANLNIAAKKNQIPQGLTPWKERARHLLEKGNDFREKVKRVQQDSIHWNCDAWKITYRRTTALCVELDFVRALVRGIG